MLIFASSVVEKTTWYPLTLGWLVVLASIGMFFGSTYLLLSTNLGARLGFLVTGAVSAGFMIVLAVLWLTTATPLNVFKGRQEQWKAVAIVQDVSSANVKEVRTIKTDGEKLTGTELANIKAAADTILKGSATEEAPEAIADDLPGVEVLVTSIYSIGGSSPNPLHFEFTHTPQYAAVDFCELDAQKLEVAFRSTCDTSPEAQANAGVLILEKDLGSLRQPPLFLALGSTALFILFLLALHWREKEGLDDLDVKDEDEDKKDKELVDA